MRDAGLRILVLLGGIPLWGQERGNIEAIDALVREAGAECLFVTHRQWGHLHVQPELDRRGLPWTTAPYAGRFEKGMPLRRWIANLATILHASLVLARLLLRFRPTHIHLCNPTYFINFLPVLLATRVPMIYRLGDEPSLHHWAYALLWRRLIAARVAEFVCISRFVQHSLRSKLGPSILAPIVYTRPPLRTSSGLPSFPRRDERSVKFAYVGQLTKEKGVDVLIDAFISMAHEREFIGYIAGDYKYKNHFALELIENVHQNHMENRILFLGETDNIDQLFDLCDVHVCPSIWQEPLGLVVLEAKRSGRPSIIFPSGGLPELVTHGVDGYICAGMTSDALKEACLYYIEDPEQAHRQGIEARRSLERLGIDSFGARWKEVYERNARPRRGIRYGRR